MKQLSNRGLGLAAALAAGSLAVGAAQAATVYANGVSPGDAFVNAGGSNQGQAVGASGWYYNNVRNSGSAGISTAYARSGNGSAALSGPSNAKADIEYLAGGTNVFGNFAATASLGKLSDLHSMQYDWYRDASSTAASHLHAALRVLIDADGDLSTLGDRGGLVFEGIYNGAGAAATNTWVTNVISGSTNVWNFGLGLGFAYDIGGNNYAYDDKLAAWQAYLKDAAILGFSAGIGSGWQSFSGAVDNIGWTIGTNTVSTNFEVTAPTSVPEPGSLALAGLALAGLAGLARRRR